jgi:hypothetical protein
MKKVQPFLCLLAFFVMSLSGLTRAYSQGVDHLTMSLQNISQPTDSTIQFDVVAVSDGDSTSDLRANSFQAGINFNTAILQSGSTLTTSYVQGTTDFSGLESFKFPNSSSANHIRITQSPHHSANTGVTMIIGHSYRIGTFLLTASAPLVVNQTPDFQLQTAVELGKTICGATVWSGSSTSLIGATVPGSGSEIRQRGQSSGMSNMRTSSPTSSTTSMPTILQRIPLSTGNSGSDLRIAKQSNSDLGLNVYPNPSRNNATLVFQSKASGDYHLSMTDATDKEVFTKDGKTVAGANNIEIDLGKFAKGVYMVNLKAGGNSSTVRTVIQ